MNRDTNTPLQAAVFLDQENKVDVQKTKDNQTNSKRNTKRPPARIPLGGKDENKVIPTLSRSHTTMDSSNVIKRAPLQNKPILAKSSSSLGFSHQGQQNQTNKAKPKGFNVRPVDVLPEVVQEPIPSNIQENTHFFNVEPNTKITQTTNTIFNPQLANRPVSLQQYSVDTDSLRKQILHREHGVGAGHDMIDIKDTISSQTNRLNSTNVPTRRIHNVDPIKKHSKNKLAEYLQDPERARIFEQLVNDENSIESRPPGPHTPLDRDIDMIDLFPVPPANSEISHGVDDIKLDDSFDMEFNEAISEEDEQMEVGLTERDLNELLDF